MGVSTDAILFYGYVWKEEQDLLERVKGRKEDDEWPDILLRRRGIRNPWDGYPNAEIRAIRNYEEQRWRGDAWMTEHRAELDAWDAQKQAVEKEFGVDIGTHCSGECSMPFVHIVEAGTSARRGYPEKLEPDALHIDPAWDAKLDRFLKELGLRKPQKNPGWYLVSYWG